MVFFVKHKFCFFYFCVFKKRRLADSSLENLVHETTTLFAISRIIHTD